MADGTWTREMQEQFEALRKAIAADIAERFETGERRLREGLSADIDARFKANEQRLDARFKANEERLDARFSASEQRLREGLSTDLDVRFAASEQRLIERIGSELDTRFQASERRLTTVITEQLETAQRHLDGRLSVHAEELSDRFAKFTEGYGGTLEGIRRELKDFRAEWRTKVDDTDRVLANHAGRLEAIEKTLPDR